MKKTLIALALTALPVASMADVVLYGKVKGGVAVSKTANVNGTTTSVVDMGSRIGFKGHERLTGNVQAIWQLEQSFDVAGGATGAGKQLGNRDSFIGLHSNYGTLKAGNLSTPVKDLSDKLDIWEYAPYNSSETGLATFTRGNDAVGRNVAISYTTPKFSGVSATAYVAPSESVGENQENRSKRDTAKYGLGLSYQHKGGFFADAAGVYVNNGKNNDTGLVHGGKNRDAFQALAQFGVKNKHWLAGLAYQYARHVDAQEKAKDTFHTNWDVANEVAASVAYNVNPVVRLKASFVHGFNIKDSGGNKFLGNGKYYQGIIGTDYKLSKRTVVNAQVGYLEAGKTDNIHQEYKTVTSLIGIVHSF